MSGFEELRKTLFGDEQRRLSELERVVLHKEALAASMAPALAGALRIAGRDTHDLAEALQDPLIEATALAARRDTYRLSEALAPIMGASIRKGITGAMRTFLEHIDTMARQACSINGLRWRFEAWRTGVPLDQVVLKYTLRYQVQDVFLIHRASGLLLAHVAVKADMAVDQDAIAGMLVAIQDFAKDAVFTRGNDALQTIDSGQSTIWLCHGELALLASVIRGAPPLELRAELQTVLDDLHALYQQPFKGFVSNNVPLPELAEHLRPLLKTELRNAEPRKSGVALPAGIVGLLIAMPAAYYGWQQFTERQAIGRLEHLFGAEPGYYVTHVSQVAGRYIVRGLADPVALRKSAELLQRTGLRADQVQLSLAPYLSLEPTFVQARIDDALRPPPGVTVKIEGSRLLMTGTAGLAWKQRAEVIAAAMPYFDSVDTGQLIVAERQQLEHLQSEIAKASIYFDDLLVMTPQSIQAQSALDQLLQDFVATAAVLDLQPCLRVLGYTDGLGGDKENAGVRERRVELVRSWLTSLGLPSAASLAANVAADATHADPRQRRVDLVAHVLDKGKTCI
jgi:outer membrane protein OmpA-like peptidoglycan-associated protein